MAPWLIPKKIGLNTIISSTRKYIKPTNHRSKITPITTNKQGFISRSKALNKTHPAKNCPMQASQTRYLLPLWTQSSSDNLVLPTNYLPTTISNLLLPDQRLHKIMMMKKPIKMEHLSDLQMMKLGELRELQQPENSRQTTQQLIGNGIGQHFWSSNAWGATTRNDPVMKHILNPQVLRAWNLINYFNWLFLWG